MVDVSEALESKYLTAQLVKESPTKVATIVSDGCYEITDIDNRRFTITVKMDEKEKIWQPNPSSVENMAELWGKESKKWFSKKVRLQCINISGKDCVLGLPLSEKPEKG